VDERRAAAIAAGEAFIDLEVPELKAAVLRGIAALENLDRDLGITKKIEAVVDEIRHW
jgi:hypothetical protein